LLGRALEHGVAFRSAPDARWRPIAGKPLDFHATRRTFATSSRGPASSPAIDHDLPTKLHAVDEIALNLSAAKVLTMPLRKVVHGGTNGGDETAEVLRNLPRAWSVAAVRRGRVIR
jgi:hypothetical protein